MKYKVGDTVRIKSIDWYNKNRNSLGRVNGFMPEMYEYLGKEAIIVKCYECSYELNIDHHFWSWDDEMFDENYYMERRIGEIFENEGVKLQCVENDGCDGCFFYNGSCLFEADMDNNGMGICSCRYRKDGKSVIFKKYNNMEQKITVPKGCKIESVEHDDNEVVIMFSEDKKKEVRTWEDLKGSRVPFDSCYIDRNGELSSYRYFFGDTDKHVFIDKKHAKSALAMAQISQLMPYYGGAITDEEWNNSDVLKYSICRNEDYVSFKSQHYELLSFHTEEQRNDFLKYNEQLVKDYLMIE